MSLLTRRFFDNRLGAMWNVLRGRPTAYRVQITAGEHSGLVMENLSFYSPDAYACLRLEPDPCASVAIKGVGRRVEPPVYDQGFRGALK